MLYIYIDPFNSDAQIEGNRRISENLVDRGCRTRHLPAARRCRTSVTWRTEERERVRSSVLDRDLRRAPLIGGDRRFKMPKVERVRCLFPLSEVLVKIIAARLGRGSSRGSRNTLRSHFRRLGAARQSRAGHRGPKIAQISLPAPFSKASRYIHGQATP